MLETSEQTNKSEASEVSRLVRGIFRTTVKVVSKRPDSRWSAPAAGAELLGMSWLPLTLSSAQTYN